MIPAHNIYIHVPFCMSKCNYCAFFSVACGTPDWNTYATGICDEIKYWGQKLGKIDVPTIFLGGGTPSLMPVGCLDKILGTIREQFNVLDGAEISLESNPATIDKEKLANFCKCGINRLSVGVQSISDEKLKFLGRRHSVRDAIDLIGWGMDLGLRVSGDFIYGLPGDTVMDIKKTCDFINNLGIEHCSLYELTIEENTPFGKMRLDMPNNDEMAQMYIAIADYLKLPRYEISNYARHGQECRHNQNVWDGQPYIGIGNGGAGRVLIEGQWYEQRGNYAQWDKMSNSNRAIEKVITGMRTICGVGLTEDVKDVINMDTVQQNPNLMQVTDGRLVATGAGRLVLDDMVVKLIR